VSPPVHLLVLFDFKQIDKNPGGDDDAQKKNEEKT
jgi:hypothetical protein